MNGPKRKWGFLLIGLFAVLVVCGGILAYKKLSKPKSILTQQNIQAIVSLTPQNIIYFEEFGEEDFTCTGLTFDKADEAFWIADYGAMKAGEDTAPRLVEIDNSFSEVLRILYLDDIVEEDANLQGIAYDNQNDSLWLATGKYVYCIDKTGSTQQRLNIKTDQKRTANGICYDEVNGTIWILYTSNSIANYDTSGNLIQEFPFNYQHQDQIFKKGDFIYITVGADYTGEDNFIVKISAKDGKINMIYRIENSYAIEGICINDGKVFVLNDGLYHSAKIEHSYVSVFNEMDVQ